MYIPVTNYPEQSFRIVLDSVSLRVRVYWSAWEPSTQAIAGEGMFGQWYMDINNDTGTIAVNGISIVGGCDILTPYAIDELGAIWLIDINGKAEEATLNSMGDRHKLVYVPVAEVDSFHRDIGWSR